MNPRIGVTVRALVATERRGVALYEYEVLKALMRLSPEIEFVLLCDTELSRDQIPDERLPVRVYPFRRGWRFNFWLQAVLPYAAMRERLDLLWCPANELPFVQTVPCVVTVHDAKVRSRRLLSAKSFAQSEGAVNAELDKLREQLSAIDPTLADALETGRRKINYQLEGLRTRFHRAQLSRDETAQRQIKRVLDQLYPEKDLQERHINITSLLARHGRYVIEWIFNAINLESTEHQILYL